MRTLIFVLLVIIFTSCENENTRPDVDWVAFKAGVIQKDYLIIEKEISNLLINTSAKPTANDFIGQETNIYNLIKAINGSELLQAQLLCYACIKTYPSQSEIIVTTDSSGISVRRIIDILTPEDNLLQFVNIHDIY